VEKNPKVAGVWSEQVKHDYLKGGVDGCRWLQLFFNDLGYIIWYLESSMSYLFAVN
jgi:hypothetical protein